MRVGLAIVLRTAIVAFVALFLGACATTEDRAYHALPCSRDRCTSPELAQAITVRTVHLNALGAVMKNCSRYSEPATYEHAWLEVNPRGYLWDTSQLKAITNRIQQIHQVEHRSVLLAVYVHGWNDNADEMPQWATKDGCTPIGRGQVDRFPGLMGRVADDVRRLKDEHIIRSNPVVIGVWVGWRGRDIPYGVSALEDMARSPISFLSRGAAANDIARADHKEAGDTTSLRDAILNLASIADDRDDRMLLWGLSFGGRIITRMFLTPPHNNIHPLGARNLIVTFNAAVGADCFEPFVDRSAASDAATKHSPPYWITFSSQDDSLRRDLYPLGSIFEPARDHCNASSPLARTAAGMENSQLTHDLKVDLRSNTYLRRSDQIEFPAHWSTEAPKDFKLPSYEYTSGQKDALRPQEAKKENVGQVNGVCFRQIEPESRGGLWNVNVDKSMINTENVEGDHNVEAENAENEADDPLKGAYHFKVFQTNLTQLILYALYDENRQSEDCCVFAPEITLPLQKGRPATPECDFIDPGSRSGVRKK